MRTQRISLVGMWEILAPSWQASLGRLPIYRNWSQPMIDEEGHQQLGMASLSLTQPSYLPRISTKSTFGEDPLGWCVVETEPNLLLKPFYRSFRGPVNGITLVTVPPDCHEVITRLGYVVGVGSYGIDGRLITLPSNLDSHDRDLEALRIALHSEWARRDQRGYLGAEMLFGMMAACLCLDASTLLPSSNLITEMCDMTPTGFANAAVSALHTFLEMGDELGIMDLPLIDPPAGGCRNELINLGGAL